MTRGDLDAFFPTVVRYVGVALMIALVVGSVSGSIDYPAGYVAALGMILYKTIKGAAENGSGR